MYTLNGSVVRLVGELSCIAACWILYTEFGLVSCIDLFFNGQFRCKINRTSSKVTAFKVNTVEGSDDLSNKWYQRIARTIFYNYYLIYKL